MIEQGVAKGGLKRPAEIRLHLGIAQMAAGRKDAAQQTLTDLLAQATNDPLAPAIRLWSIYAGAPALLPPRQ
ncbi:MAG: tetratricopeptide repeat protein [Rubrivivax sp.]